MVDRRVAAWAADCAERVLGAIEAEAPDDDRPRVLIARTRAFARGEVSTGEETCWQLDHMAAEVRIALRSLPPVGENAAGPLGAGLLASGQRLTIIRELQSRLARTASG
jgi:hypothetical protein